MPYNLSCDFLLVFQKTAFLNFYVSLVSIVWAENKIKPQVDWSLMDSLGEESSLQLKVTNLCTYRRDRVLNGVVKCYLA